MNITAPAPSCALTVKTHVPPPPRITYAGQEGAEIPCAPSWRYVTAVMRGGAQHQLWRHATTKELRWLKL